MRRIRTEIIMKSDPDFVIIVPPKADKSTNVAKRMNLPFHCISGLSTFFIENIEK